MAAATNQNEHDMKTPSSSASASQDRDHDHQRHVHFTEEDINRKKGKEHNENYHSADTHMPEPLHVNFTQEDIQRKEGKNHKDYPKTYAHVAKSRTRPRPQSQSQSGYEPHNGSWETSLNGSTKVKVSKEDFFLHLKIGCAMLILFFGGTMIASYKFANNQNAGADANAENGAVATEKKSVYDDILEREQNQLKLMEPPYPLLNEQLIRRTATGSSTADHDHDDDDDDRAYTLNAECNLFLADSSIPGHGRGLGVFTTKSFEEGEVVFPGLGLGSGLEGGLEADAFGTKGIELPLHSHLVLLKQHHIYGNVIQGSSKQQKQGGGDGSITSKRSIQAGEELFVNFQDLNENYKEIYHKQLHVHDPTLEEYQMADEIIAEAMAAIPTKVVYEGSGDRNVKKYKSGRGRNKQRTKRVVPSVDAASILNLLKSTVARYDQRLAALIPESTAEARSILDDSGEGGGGTANFISNRRSVDWIRANGLCLDGLYPGLSSAISTGTDNGAGKSAVGTFASRDVSIGDIITTAPLYAMKKSHSVANMHCYDAPVDDISLCPLSFAALMHNGDDEEKVCINSDENEDCPSTVGPANAKVQWSEFNMSNRRRNDITADEFIQHPLTGMTVDVIATQPISKGEEVIISSNNGNLFHS